MSDFKKHYDLWDEFLRVWPKERLATMTLDLYTQAGSKDSFTYWIESRLDQLGSIWGGSSFKFGVFSRKDTDDRKSDAKLSYSDIHGWYSSLGVTAEEAFTQVRGFVVQVATLAAKGDLEGIEKFDHLGEAYKWKIAFHYQDRNVPTIVDIFKKAPLSAFAGDAADRGMAALQKAALAKRPADLGILEFGRQVWNEWSQKNLAIWKLSHGNPPNFTDDERQAYLNGQLAVMHRDTGKDQGKKFTEAPVGTLFYLCHGNSPQRIGQFTSEAVPCAKGDGWLQRSYRILKSAIRTDRYQNNSKYWSPQGNTTFWQVGANDLPEFDRTLLVPYFGTSLAELAGMLGEPIEATSVGRDDAESLSDEELLQHFDGNAAFKEFRALWSPEAKAAFCRLARVVHAAGLDWWHMGKSIQVRFGRKSPGSERAVGVLGLIRGKRTRTISWARELGEVPKVNREPLTGDLISKIEAALATDRDALDEWLSLETERPGLWPDQLRDDPNDPGEEADDDEVAMTGTRRQACNRIYYGPPGTGKTYVLQELKTHYTDAGTGEQRYVFVTFHQSYGYEEFVEGLRPVLDSGTASGQVRYEIRSGAFRKLCSNARLAPNQQFAMLIDEINRGNISKIFGELITLIELDKRDPLDGTPPPVKVALAYSGEPFSVPANVDVIGTMNTADRSLALVDTALRRRFDFVPRMPDTQDAPGAPLYGLRVTAGEKVIDIPAMLASINQRVESLYDRDHTIGHAYFTALGQKNPDGTDKYPDGPERFEELTKIFRNKIMPLLEEYFFEDWQKIRLVLADNQKAEAACFVTVSGDQEGELASLFGSEHGLEEFATKKRYALQNSAFSDPAAYVGIYETTGH